jgi:ABC-type branched-subunit amino acid transport system substrate-binding protein
MHLSRGVAVVACTAAVLLSAAACKSGDTESESSTVGQVRLYGSDGNMLNSVGAKFTDQQGVLAGMRGTAPMTPLPDGFVGRLQALDPKLNDYPYVGETYDAVVITALAAELAGTTTPGALAKYINGVTTGGQECDSVKQCLALARAGTDLAYRGVSLRRGGFTDAGEPSTASYATLQFDATDKLDNGKTEYVGAGDESTTTKAPAPPPRPAQGHRPSRTGAPLKIGELLSKTGALAGVYAPMHAAAELALNDVNAAGGVLDKPVQYFPGDDGTDPSVAAKTVRRHIDEGVHVIIGAAASGVSNAILPDVVKAGLILFSPSNTAAGLSDVDDKGLYFRTAPSDLLQGKALADVMMRDSVQRVAIVARADAYGEGLQRNVSDELQRAGLPADQIKLMKYQAPEGSEEPDVSDAVRQVKSFNPDSVLVIGFEESATMIKGLLAAGVRIRH